jgi:hypothetical protein
MASLVEQICTSVAMLTNHFSQKHPERVGPAGQGYQDASEDRAEWDCAWSSQSHRRLDTPLKIDLTSDLRLGKIVSATISEDPPEFSDQGFRQCDECPICGQTTVGMLRRAASVHPEFETGISNLSLGVWVHNECFEQCPETGEPAPIPW